MSIKVFSFKGINGVLTVASIVIPAVTWLMEKYTNKDKKLIVAGKKIYDAYMHLQRVAD